MAVDKKKIFSDFLSKNKILIVDKSSASRRRLAKSLVDFGAKRNLISSVAHFEEAKEAIDEHRPKLILSDYNINGGSGFDLFSYYRSQHSDIKDSVLVLITSNISQSAVAKAAEEDVDQYIIKPYTISSFEKNLVKIIYKKLHPSKYIRTIEKGKKALFESKFDEAFDYFTDAIELNKEPSLALFYRGQVETLRNEMKKAEGEFNEGLSVCKIHFKCQVGLYEILMKQKRLKEAYAISRNIAKFFPANPDRLCEVIHLCVQTGNFEDLDEYYQHFLNLDDRTPETINYMCSGLFVLTKYNFIKKKFNDAITTSKKLSISSAGITKFLRETIFVLAEYEYYENAQSILKRFPAGDVENEDYFVARYVAYQDTMSNVEIISGGLDLIQKKYNYYSSYKLLLSVLKKEKQEKRYQEVLDDAKKLWPEKFVSNQDKAA